MARTSMTPPAAPLPSALTAPVLLIFLPVMITAPPAVPPSRAETSSTLVLVRLMFPAVPASSRITPPLLVSDRARITPELLIELPNAALVACADSKTCPPLAIKVPLLSTRALTEAGVTASCSRLFAPTPTVTASPAAMAMSPEGAVIVPWLLTFKPSNTARPPLATVMLPWLVTPAVELPRVKMLLPALKLASVMPRLLAVNPPTLTCAELPNSTPDGLTM